MHNCYHIQGQDPSQARIISRDPVTHVLQILQLQEQGLSLMNRYAASVDLQARNQVNRNPLRISVNKTP
jgi:hypothetical protein